MSPVTQSIRPGENTNLAGTTGSVIITHTAAMGLDVNLTAFLVTEDGKVLNDEGMVFFNAPEHPSGAAIFVAPQSHGGAASHRIRFDLARLPAGISRIAVTLTEDGSTSGFGSVNDLRAEVQVAGQIIQLAPGIFSSEKGIIVADLYVRNGQPKARAVWQGFASGLAGLCCYYGVEVEQPAPPPAPAPVNMTKSFVSLSKPSDVHKISLAKGPDAPGRIVVKATWIDNGDGYDNDDLDLRVGILLPDGRMKMIQAPERSGAFNAEPYVVHTGDVTAASFNQPATETVEVNPEISRRLGGRVALVVSVYSAISNGAVSVASLQPKMRMEYGNQIIECAYDFNSRSYEDGIYTYVIGLIEIDQDSIRLRPSGATSDYGSESTPWLRWQGESAHLTMDGPPVFKGLPLIPVGDKAYC